MTRVYSALVIGPRRIALAALLGVGLLLSRTASAKILSFRLEGRGTNTTVCIGDKTRSPEELVVILTKLHSLDSNQTMLVYCDETNAVAELAPLLILMRKCGFRKATVGYPTAKDGAQGVQYISLQIDDPPDFAPSCVGLIPLKDGFWNSSANMASLTNLVELPLSPIHMKSPTKPSSVPVTRGTPPADAGAAPRVPVR